MQEQELFDYLDGFIAFDKGCVDSGIHDSIARGRVLDYMKSLQRKEAHALVARFLIEHYLSPQALARGCGPDDAREFLNWLEDDFGFSLN